MPSIRRVERPASLVALVTVLLGAAGVTYALATSRAPDEPVYRGSGNDSPVAGGVFQAAVASQIRSLDPAIAYDVVSYTALRLLFDGLLDYDADGRIVPVLAEGMPDVSEDGRTFTFRLKRDVRFHSGHLLDAHDVKWSIERVLRPSTASGGMPFFLSIEGASAFREGEAEHVSGIEVLDARRVRFTLSEPDQTFLNVMAMPFAYPVNRLEIEGRPAHEVARMPDGTGPYRVRGPESWERGVALRVHAFGDYHDASHVGPGEYVLWENVDGSLQVARFRRGDLDVIMGAPPVHYFFFKESPAWRPYITEVPEPSVYGLAMNCEVPPFDDVHVRRAVAFAINRAALRQVQNDRVIDATQILPPMIAPHDAALPERQVYDPARARAELAASRYAGYDQTIEAWIGASPRALEIAQVWKQDLEAIGLSVELQQVAFTTYLEETGRRGRVAMFTSGWSMDFPDASNFMDPLFHSRAIHDESSENRAFYSNPELDRLLDEARRETNRERRLGLYRQANAIIARDAPWAMLFYPRSFEAWQPYVRGYRPHPVWDYKYRTAWLDLPRLPFEGGR